MGRISEVNRTEAVIGSRQSDMINDAVATRAVSFYLWIPF